MLAKTKLFLESSKNSEKKMKQKIDDTNETNSDLKSKIENLTSMIFVSDVFVLHTASSFKHKTKH